MRQGWCDTDEEAEPYYQRGDHLDLNEAVESLRLLKAFLRLAPRERFEVIELVERLATEGSSGPDHPLS